MFSHIATNIKDTEKLKTIVNEELNINIDTFEKKTYNLSDILAQDKENNEQLKKELYENLLIGRIYKKIVILFYDNVDDIKLIDEYSIVSSNCIIFEN